MSEIIVKNQKKFNDIPKDFQGYIYIESPKNSRIIIAERKGIVIAWGNASVEAWGNASVVAWGNASVEAWGNASVEAWGNASVEAWGNASVVARENASVVAWGNASVVARENASVVARENASVVAWGNASVEAWGNASVEAWGNASVEAWENASVEAWENVQIANYSDFTNLTTHGNSRIVLPPRTPEEYCSFYGIEIRDGQAVLYKAVRKDGGSFHDSNFHYQVGQTLKHPCDLSVDFECSHGLHVAHLHWAIEFGRGRDFKIIECLVPLDKIVVPKFTDGKVRTSELRVTREVPMEEWGVYGKILAARGK